MFPRRGDMADRAMTPQLPKKQVKAKSVKAWAVVDKNGNCQEICLRRVECIIDYADERIIRVEVHPVKQS